ncbi:L,D-transpeptidase [Microbacterium sp.]|uniref:L,D-transpeptidase n=1 Tax=Microbacterium sp. TaxID=51671 RepID=UPI002627D2B5|nr:L,D-transpeptidase [Microbacterium sp.]
MVAADESPPAGDHRHLAWVIVGAILAVAIAAAAVYLVWPRPEPAPAATPEPVPVITPTPTPSPTPTGHPENTTTYDLTGLPEANVLAVIPALPVDDEPDAAFAGFTAHAVSAAAPIWADPTGDPVAVLPHEFVFDGTTVAVVERQDHWVRVLLAGRQAQPSSGNPAQITGWLRSSDVELTPVDTIVEVDISDRTIDIVRGAQRQRVATDFAWGADTTPTPTGRSFVMMTRVVESFGYTRGWPLVYLSVQSPTLDAFGGSDAAVTAFHYHDTRSGPISNGCIRVDETAIAALADVPLGAGVIIRP